MTTAVYAAGAVCWRMIDGKLHVLVIHRTVYGDVTIPKGKVEPGESLPRTAVREIAEETGLDVALGVPLGISRYPLPSRREKIVHYWAAEVSERAVQRSTFKPNAEIAALEWVTIKRARGYLSYAPDVEILDNFAKLVDQGVTSTFALMLVRHGKAVGRSGWTGTDAARPLVDRGVQQAAALVRHAHRVGAEAHRLEPGGALRDHGRAALRGDGHHGQARGGHQPGRVGVGRMPRSVASSANGCARASPR